MRWCNILMAGTLALGGCSGCNGNPLPEVEKRKERPADEWARELTSTDQDQRLTAAMALGVMGEQGKPGIPALSKAVLYDGSWVVRWQAAWSLGHVDPEGREVVQPLTAALRDPDWRVRSKAAEMLAKLGTVSFPAVDLLIDLLMDRQPEVRLHAAMALGNIGPDADRSLRYLRIVRDNDSNPAVRLGADEAVKLIEGR